MELFFTKITIFIICLILSFLLGGYIGVKMTMNVTPEALRKLEREGYIKFVKKDDDNKNAGD